MRFRPLIVSSIALVLLLSSAPAYAEDPALIPTPGTSQAPLAETPPVETPIPGDPKSKVEDGLGVDGGTERAIVELADPAQHTHVATQATAESMDVVLQPQSQSFMVVEGTAEELARLAENPQVSSIHRDRTYLPADLGPNLALIGADKVHAQNNTGAGQAVAILDTGIDPNHPWFAGRIVAQACFSATEDAGVESLCPNGQNKQTDGNAADATTEKCQSGGVNMCDHGTHVAGIAAGTGGVAPGASIVAVQVFSRINDEEACGEPSCVMAYESSLREAMDYVATLNQPIAAVNLSLGSGLYETNCDGTEEGAIFKQKIDTLLAKNIATVAAAGNEYFDGAGNPACVSSAVSVGANDNSDAIADFSNRGPLLDLFAPGVDIESSVPGGATTVYSGTSMATPHVTGALALMKAASPNTPMTELIDKLKSTGRPYVYDSYGTQVTTPRLDLAAALTGAAIQPPVPQSPVTEPVPTEGSGPSPEPEPEDPSSPEPGPTPPSDPIPLPTVTVWVTVTHTAAPAAEVCTRGSTARKKTAANWAIELHRGTGAIPDDTLACYLQLIGKASRVFPELTKASSLGTAYRVLKDSKTGKAKLDSALLAAWLNWAHGTNGTTALTTAEKVRLSSQPSAATLTKATNDILKTVK